MSQAESQRGLISLCRFVLLVSGLGLGSGSGESLLGTQLLVDVVTGQLGAEGGQSGAANISRVLLAGNLLSQNTQSRDTINKVPGVGDCGHGWACWGLEGTRGHSLSVSPPTQAKYLTKKTQAASVEAVKMLDEILLQLCVSVQSGTGLARQLGTFWERNWLPRWGGDTDSTQRALD